jgi:hypothetical protein
MHDPCSSAGCVVFVGTIERQSLSEAAFVVLLSPGGSGRNRNRRPTREVIDRAPGRHTRITGPATIHPRTVTPRPTQA